VDWLPHDVNPDMGLISMFLMFKEICFGCGLKSGIYGIGLGMYMGFLMYSGFFISLSLVMEDRYLIHIRLGF
jgi:hypothetical protein